MLKKPIPNENDLALNSYRAAASVLVYFHSDRLLPLESTLRDDSAVMDLLEECIQSQEGMDTGSICWMLKNSVRRLALQQLGSRQAIKLALAANTERPDHILQSVFEALVNQTSLSEFKSIDGLYAQLQAYDWLEGIVDHLPDRNILLAELELQQLLQPFHEIAGIHFRGRTHELDTMRTFVTERRAARSVHSNPVLMVYGPGGVGKSTLVAKFILDTLDVSSFDQFSFVYLDFERAALWPEEPVTLLAEMVQQLGIQFPIIKTEAITLRNQWLQQLVNVEVPSDPSIASLRKSLNSDVVQSRSDTVTFLAQLGSFVQHVPESRERCILLVLDSFERVQRSHDLVTRVFDFLNELHTFFPYLRIVISGRVEVTEYNTQPLLIGNLDAEATDGLLESKGIRSSKLRATIFKRVGGDPLSLWLTVDVLRREFNLATLDHFSEEFDGLTLDHAQNQTWLYWRYLQRIRNPLVQKLAHPGLVLRRVTPGLIRYVLAEPCQVDVPDDDTAVKLFEELAKEVSLVLRETPTRVRHRPDVRSRMLRGLMQDAGRGFFEIHRRAVDYYVKQPPDSIGRAEEIYHRFFLRTSREELDTRWAADNLEGVAAQLADALQEIPPTWQPYLAQRIGNTAYKIDWNEVEQRDWEPYAATRATELMAANEYQEALKVLNERETRLPGSPLYRQKAICLEHLGQYPAAITCANEGIFSALQVDDVELQWDLTLIALRSSEQLGRWEQARKLLAEAATVEIKSAPPIPDIMALELDMHRLRLCRLDPTGCIERKDEIQARSAKLLTDKFEPVASVRMDLVIDLAEEIGREHPQLLSLVVNLQRPVLSQEPMQSSLTAFIHEWLRTNGGTKDNGERLAEIRKELNDGNVYSATVGLLTFYSDAILPSQWHSSLIAILRATIQQPIAGETLNQRLVRQLQTTLAEYFGNREELLKFLRDEFPAIEPYLQEGDNYSDVLNDAAEAFEREGQTEALLSILKQRSNSISVAAAAETVQLISSGQINTGGGAYIGGAVSVSGDYVGRDQIISNIYKTVLSILPQEIPESLALVSPILTTMHIDPDALFNWAAAMRAVTRTIARFDTVKGYLTGFLIAPDLVMTLNFDQTDEELGKSKLRFQHVLSTSVATFENPTLYSLEKRPPLWVNKRLRCAVFQLAGTPGTDLIPLTDGNRGWLRLAKQSPNPGDYACCVHFPGGESLRLSSALVAHDAERKIKLTLLDKQLMMQYGSIGAPWFNQRWEVIGLHLGIRPTKQKESNSATVLSVSWLDRLLSNKEFSAILNKHIPADEKPIRK